MTFLRQLKEFMLLTVSDSRISRNIRHFQELQAVRKAEQEKALEAALLLIPDFLPSRCY